MKIKQFYKLERKQTRHEGRNPNNQTKINYFYAYQHAQPHNLGDMVDGIVTYYILLKEKKQKQKQNKTFFFNVVLEL